MSTLIRQSDLFETAPDAMPHGPSPARMRLLAAERIEALLREITAADRMPWDAQRERINRIIFPQMINWLPAEEGQARLAAFHAELRRLGAG